MCYFKINPLWYSFKPYNKPFQWPFHKGASALLSLFSLTLGILIWVSCLISLCVYVCIFQYFHTFWHYKELQSHLVYWVFSIFTKRTPSIVLSYVICSADLCFQWLSFISCLSPKCTNLKPTTAMKDQQVWNISCKIKSEWAQSNPHLLHQSRTDSPMPTNPEIPDWPQWGWHRHKMVSMLGLPPEDQSPLTSFLLLNRVSLHTLAGQALAV